MGYKTLFEQIKTVCALNSLRGRALANVLSEIFMSCKGYRLALLNFSTPVLFIEW